MARHTLEVFRDAEYVVLPSGSCTTMLRVFNAELFEKGSGEEALAADLAGRTYELAEFLVRVMGVENVGAGLRGKRIAYHFGCHALRELGLQSDPITLLDNAGAKVVDWEAAQECCGFGGLFAVKMPELSVAMADRKLDTLPPLDLLTSADGGCLLHLAGRIHNRGIELSVRHLADVLWEACRASA
jgi:L-lactate dehydrogenase complex protein LldE